MSTESNNTKLLAIDWYFEMADKFSNLSSSKVAVKLQDDVQRQLMRLGSRIVFELQSYIMKTFYDKYDPVQYNRTFSLINALRYKVEGNALVIFYDRRRFKWSNANQGSNWKPHRASFKSYEGIKWVEPMINFMIDENNEGLTMPICGRGEVMSPQLAKKATELFEKYNKNEKIKLDISNIETLYDEYM